MKELRPTSGKAELALSYQCDLECRACTRASFLREAHTPAMTREDAEEFFRQADELGWKPRIVLTGGEPTMHPDFDWFVWRCFEWSKCYVQVFSNATTDKAKKKLDMVRGPGSINPDTHKVKSVESDADYPGWVDDTFVSPTDLGKPLRPICYQSSAEVCGISVDHLGYSPCAIGGAIDSLLHVGGRTKRLADLFDPEKFAAMQAALCAHCGFQGQMQGLLAKAEVDALPRVFGAPMTPTWAKAFEGRR